MNYSFSLLTFVSLQLTLSTWYKWRRYDSGPDGRISGTVCGQDPR